MGLQDEPSETVVLRSETAEQHAAISCSASTGTVAFRSTIDRKFVDGLGAAKYILSCVGMEFRGLCRTPIHSTLAARLRRPMIGGSLRGGKLYTWRFRANAACERSHLAGAIALFSCIPCTLKARAWKVSWISLDGADRRSCCLYRRGKSN